MDIKEIALKLQATDRFRLNVSELSAIEFAEALIPEIAKQNVPVAWCVGYDDPRMGRIHSNPTMCKPEAEALVKSTTSELIVCSLYALPPTAEQIANETAEAIVDMLQQKHRNCFGAHSFYLAASVATANGEWRKFVKEV